MNKLVKAYFKHIRKYSGRDSAYELAKEWRRFKITLKNFFANTILILLGIISAGFGLKGFLLPNDFIDGGATGISLLFSELFEIPLSILLIVVNLPFIILGFRTISTSFAVKTILAIIGLAICVAIVPYPQVTSDKLLVAVFGGFFLGAGIGLSIRGGAVIDGTEVLAIAVSKKNGLTIGDIILIINIIIFSATAYLLSVEVALYAILTYLAAAKTVDFIIEGIEEHTGVTIVSVKSDEIRKMITEEMGRGVTVYKGERGFGKSGERNYDMNIIYTVITRLEITKLKTEIEKIDAYAFVVMSSIKDTKGGMIKKKPLKH